MANLKSRSDMKFTITMELSEIEARALHAITVYGFDAFTKIFYNSLGKHYLLPYDDGLADLFGTINENLPYHLNKFDEARKVFK